MAPEPLVLQVGAITSVLEVLRLHWMPGSQIGLGSADIRPRFGTSIAQIVPADFSGYPGLLVLGTWGPVRMVGERGVIDGPLVTWTHNGGPKAQTVFTFYVTSATGVLRFCERLPGGPMTLFRAGQSLTVRPQYTYRSEYT